MTRTSISKGGAVVLSDSLVCDGFLHTAKVRVQTHVHDDHMEGFASSKIQTIACSPGTRDLLIAEFNADLAYRRNLVPVDLGVMRSVEDEPVELLDAGHMLGSVQVKTVHRDGYRTGYSGDFSWPLESVIQVDELVVDSTYGSPDSVRRYSQGDAEECFVERALTMVKSGPVIVHAHRGTLQRAISLLDDATQLPLLASERQLRESAVYAGRGLVQARITDAGSSEGQQARADGRYIMFVGKGDPQKELLPNEYKIILSAFMVPSQEPMLEVSERQCRVALSDHADFDGTLEYIAASGAKRVLTDNVRGPHGVALAEAVRSRLGLEAEPATPPPTRGWGGGS